MVLFMVLVYKGHSLFWVTPLMAVLIAITNFVNPVEAFATTFTGGVAGAMIQNWSILLLGGILSKVFQDTGGAQSMANLMLDIILGKEQKKTPNIYLAVGTMIVVFSIITICGIPGMVLALTMLPVMINICDKCDIPRRFVPALLVCQVGVQAFPGAPVFYNVFVSGMMGTSATAGLIPGLVGVVVILLLSFFYLSKSILKAKKRGEHFEYGALEKQDIPDRSQLPHPVCALIPIIAVFISYAFFKVHVSVALTIGIVGTLIFCGRHFQRKADGSIQARNLNMTAAQSERPFISRFLRPTCNALTSGSAMGVNTLMMMSFPAGISAVVAATAAYTAVTSYLGTLPIHPLLLAMLLTCVIVALTASPTAAVPLVCPLMISLFVSQGSVEAGAVHRVVSQALATFETLPVNGMVVALIGMAKSTHKESYKPMFMTTVFFTLIGTCVVTALLMLFPGLA